MEWSGQKQRLFTEMDGFDDTDCELRGKTIEELKYEIDVMKYYRTLLIGNPAIPHSANSYRSRRSKQSSKAVQTDPDTSTIPPSWLRFSQELVGELYTGLANMVNTLFHTPNGYCKGDVAKTVRVPQDAKYFTYEKGYWQSKLLPQVRIPAAVGIEQQIHSENFKNELNRLLEKATRLQNGIPDVMEIEQGDDQVDEFEECASRSPPDGGGGVKGKVGEVGPSDAPSRADFTQKSQTHSSTSGFRAQFRANPNEPAAKRSVHVFSSRGIEKAREPEPVQGVTVSECDLPPQTSRTKLAPKKRLQQAVKCIHRNDRRKNGGKITKPSASKGTENQLNREKNDGKTTTDKTIKGQNKTDDAKNFIKRNILASKFPTHRGAATSKAVISATSLVFHKTEQRDRGKSKINLR